MNECDYIVDTSAWYTKTPLSVLARSVYEANRLKGFWNTEESLLANESIEDCLKAKLLKSLNAQRIALMHSELSEALEADRKDLMDDKLPEYKGVYVEVVDTLIRALDFLGGHNAPVDEIFKSKLEYNKTRPYLHGKKY